MLKRKFFYWLTISNFLYIIVLLILAGITIATLTGENGILTKATEAGRQTEIEGIREEAEMAKQGVLSGDLTTGKDTTREDVINGIVDEMGGTATGNLITTEDGKYEIMVKEDNTIEVVEKGQGYIDAEYKEAAPESDFRWTTLEDGTVRIYEYLGTETSLHIPDTIDGKTVSMLKMDKTNAGDSSGFVEGGKLSQNGVVFKSVKIPDTVTVVGYRAFWDNEIEELKLSKNLTKIETFAFADNKIKEIEVPEGVTTIGMLSFGGENLQKLIIPSTITSVRMSSFDFSNIDYIEFMGNTFVNSKYTIYADTIKEIKVPYSEDHSVLEYYQGLIGSTIKGEVETISEKEI